jgi:peroxiredoxin
MSGAWFVLAGALGALLVVVVVGLAAALFQVVKLQGRLLLRLDSVDDHLRTLAAQVAASTALRPTAAPPPAAAAAMPPPAPPRGLPVGAPLPPFALRDLDGRTVTLEDFRGTPTLLVHWGPGCGFCDQIAPDLAAVQAELERRRIRLALVSHGDAATNRALAERFALRCPILLNEDGDTIEAFRTFGTPVAYLVDERGLVAARIAIGANEVPALVRRAVDDARPRDDADSADGSGRRNGEHHDGDGVHAPSLPGRRPLSESRLERAGLRAGTLAPAFALPDLDGRLVSLDAHRGRPLLLVFSDPHCGPCNALAPELAALHRRHAGDRVAIVMVSRGDADENRSKVAAHGIGFPVVLQAGWELSKAYGIFATPVAFLIDGDGVIARDVATGADAILALAAEALRVGAPVADRRVVRA